MEHGARESDGKLREKSRHGRGTYERPNMRDQAVIAMVPMSRRRQPRDAKIRVLIADDHPVIREGLNSLINRSRDMRVIAEAANGHQAVQHFFQYNPDVLLLDLRIPILNGLEVLQSILLRDPTAKVIILSSYNLYEDVYQALKAGAKAYLLKDSPREELLESIRSVHMGQIKLSPKAAIGLATAFNQSRLTKRETEIMRMMAAGKSNKEIAAALGPTEGTVKVHVGHILKKLTVTGRSEAIRTALERGIVHLTSD
jgi:two-component system NarL family response regulator